MNCAEGHRIRLKNANHISLDYGKAYEFSSEREAQVTNFFRNINMECTDWNIVFYERRAKSDNVSIPHQFHEIARWNLNIHI
jgi:hypothetical protein